MLGNGGRVTFGILGMVGKLGSGGSVGLGRDGGVVGKVGNVGCGRLGVVGKGGKFGTEGRVGICRRWRAATTTWMFENDRAMKKMRMKHLKETIFNRAFLHTPSVKNSVVICVKNKIGIGLI
jgi:hypothetical protein